MALRRGKNPRPHDGCSDASKAGGLLFAGGRLVGFCLLMPAALAILAGVVLLPAYGRLADAAYERNVQAARVADSEAMVAANERLIDAAENDPVLVKRLNMNIFGSLPPNEFVVIDPDAPTTLPPGVVRPPRRPRPAAPAGVWIRAAKKLNRPATRRGLFLLAAAAMLAAMFLFAPPRVAEGDRR